MHIPQLIRMDSLVHFLPVLALPIAAAALAAPGPVQSFDTNAGPVRLRPYTMRQQ